MKNTAEMSRDERRIAKQIIELRTQEVIEAYNDSETPSEAIKALVEKWGHAEAVEMVATVANRVSIHDGRVSNLNREWAQATTAPSNEEMKALQIYGVDSWIHSAHVDQLAQAMRRYEPTEEEKKPRANYTAEAAEVMEIEQKQVEPAEEETTDHAAEVLAEVRESITASREGNRSAWGRGVTAYALELLDSIEEALRGGWISLDDLESRNGRQRAMLNGASSWDEFSWGGCSLIYNGDIAERLCTPSELRKTDGGRLRPNSREEWLDTQARALFQASNRVSTALRSALMGV